MNIHIPPCVCGERTWMYSDRMKCEETPEGMSCESIVFTCYECGRCGYYFSSEGGTALVVSEHAGDWHIGGLIEYTIKTLLPLWKVNFEELEWIRMILDCGHSPALYISKEWLNPSGFDSAPIPLCIPEDIYLMVRVTSLKHVQSWSVLTHKNLPKHKE